MFRAKVKMTVGRIFRNLLILHLAWTFSTAVDISNSSVGHLKLDYTVIQATGKFCPGRDSCQSSGRQNRGPEGIENDWKKRNCFCDDQCANFGDCCIDANAYRQHEQMTIHSQFECLNYKQYGDIYVKNKCPDTWSDQEVTSRCEKPEVTSADPLSTMPVTNIGTGITYSNFYCSVCNSDTQDVQFWNPRLECPTLTGYASRFNNISSNYIADHLVYDKGRSQWGVQIDMGGVAVFHECYIDPAMPNTSAEGVRSCSGKSTIVGCPDDYRDDNVRELCHSYTALIFEPNTAYRNVHCAICNNAALDKLICLNLGPFGRFNWQTNFNSFSFAVLFDMSGDQNTTVGFNKANCNEGELYDPFFKKCRNISCGSDKKIYRQGRCIDATIFAETTSTTTTTTAKPTKTTTTSTTTTESSSTEATTTPAVTTTIESVTTTELLTTTTVTAELTTAVAVESSTSSPKIDEITLVTDSIETVFETSSPNVSTESSNNTEGTTKRNSSENLPIKFPEERSDIVDKKPKVEVSDTGNDVTEFVDCPKFELQVGEFKMVNDSSVYIEKYDKTLGSDQFDLMDNNVLVICATLGGATDQVAKFGKYMSYVTLVCLGISIVCLLFHIIATFISPDLQNLSGKNLFSLSLALLGSYISFIAAMFRGRDEEVEEDSGCFALAVLMYFFFMSSFFWMLVIAFDVCRTLRLATTQLRLSTGSQWKKFTVYSLFAWILPLTFAVITVIVDRLKDVVPGEYRPGFGDHELCWFSNKKALLVYFAVPFAGVMGFNIFLFLFSAYIVYDTTKSGAKMTSCGPKTNFHLYLRLAVIMGLTWVTGLAAGFVNLEPLWYAFVALNTLQGLFIFVAFTCTKKVISSLRDRLTTTKATFSGSGSDMANASRPGHSRLQKEVPWKWSKDNTASTSAGSVSGKRSDIGSAENTLEKGDGSIPNTPDSTIPSRYGSRSKTMYTVSKYQANCSSYQNSFDGRYY